MLIALIAGLAITTDPADDPERYSAWIRHACEIQQVDYNGGGEPADYVEFCGCSDTGIRETGPPAIYRVFAPGSQAALQDRSMLENWMPARDTAAMEAAALPADGQARIQPVLQGALGACMGAAG